VFSRVLSLLSKRLLQTILVLGVLLVVVFFALTRTQVGRNELARQVERAFSERYEGNVSIHRLTGNLLNTLYADDVALLTAEGDTVAFFDSVVVEPHWSALLQRSFSVRSIELYAPLIRIEPPSRHAGPSSADSLAGATPDSASDSTVARTRTLPGTTLGRALSRRSEAVAADPNESRWRFQGARLRMENGMLVTNLREGQLTRLLALSSPGWPGSIRS